MTIDFRIVTQFIPFEIYTCFEGTQEYPSKCW